MSEKNIINFEPHLGVIVYRNARQNKHYLQVHTIEKIGGKFNWKEGKPFRREQLQELALSLRTEQLSTLKLKSLLPENVIYFQPAVSGNKFVWFLKPDQYHLTFAPILKIKDGNYRFPGLILAVKDKDLYIYAYKGTNKPGLKTELFNAPFYNVYEDGEVCMGTISESRKKIFLDEEIQRWQNRFFGGRFTDAHGAEGQVSKGFNMKTAYKDMATGKTFNEKILAPAEFKTLDVFMKRIMEGGRDE